MIGVAPQEAGSRSWRLAHLRKPSLRIRHRPEGTRSLLTHRDWDAGPRHRCAILTCVTHPACHAPAHVIAGAAVSGFVLVYGIVLVAFTAATA